MSDLVGNPEDRFSHNEAHIMPDAFQINGIPHAGTLETGTYRISYSGGIGGGMVIVSNPCGMTAMFNGISKARMYLSSTAAADAVGLCGNGNDNTTDNMVMRNGTILQYTGSDKKLMYKLVGDSWLVPDQWIDRNLK